MSRTSRESCTFRKFWLVICGNSGGLGRWCLWAGVEVKRRAAGAVGAAAELDMPAALEHAVEDGFREIRIVEHSTPRGQRLVGREDHWALVHLYEERIEIVTKTGAVVPHPRCARGVSILPEHRAALLDRVHGARGHLYFQRQSLWELGPHAEAWLKSDPVCLDTVWTRITAAKEAGHDRQGAKANHDAWQ